MASNYARLSAMLSDPRLHSRDGSNFISETETEISELRKNSNPNVRQLVFWFSEHSDFHSCHRAELDALLDLVQLKSVEEDEEEQFNFERKDKISKDVDLPADEIEKVPSDWQEKNCKDMTQMRNVCRILTFQKTDILLQQLKFIMSRSILIKFIAELLDVSNDFESLRSSVETSINKLKFRKLISSNGSFAFECDSHGKKMSLKENVAKMNALGFLFSGSEIANMESPGVKLFIGQDFDSLGPRGPYIPRTAVFGVVLASRPREKKCLIHRLWWHKYSLQTRSVLGPTSLDSELGFIMANMACIKPGDIVFDPFVGTGGLLIPAVELSQCSAIGTELDIRVVRGWGVASLNKTVKTQLSGPTHIFRNFKDYKLVKPDIVLSDIARHTFRSPRLRPFADIVLTDPPYGVRACVRTTTNPDAKLDPSKGHTSLFAVSIVISKLLELSGTVLVPNGRLVFLLPVDTLNESIEEVVKSVLEQSKNFGFSFITACPQELSGGLVRFVISMVKKPTNK